MHPQLETPIALALVRDAQQNILTLQGLLKVDFPGIHVRPGENDVAALRARLAFLGVYAPRLSLLWQAVALWAGKQRPVTVYDAPGWSGTPTEVCLWSTEEEVTRGQRAELYRRFFGRMRERAEARDHATLAELPLEKPRSAPCPRCGSSLRLRNRRPGQEVRFDCRACMSAFALRAGAFCRIPSLA
jgi:hypothetical protein